MVEQNQTSCTQAAAAAAAALAAAVHRKSFGKTADQVDHSTMGYTPSACIASSCSSLDMSQESVPLKKAKLLISMNLVLKNVLGLLFYIQLNFYHVL